MERKALQTAFKIGAATNRIVILPVFHCHKCGVYGLGGRKEGCRGGPGDPDTCNYLAHFRLKELDASGLPYREAMFRHHPLVPKAVGLGADEWAEDRHASRESADPAIFIASPKEPSPHTQRGNDVRILTPENVDKGPSLAELREWFDTPAPVVTFHSLYNVRVDLGGDLEDAVRKKWDRGVKKAPYRQYD